jgi:hypothetical protein
MGALVLIAVLSAGAGTAVMLLGVVAKRSLDRTVKVVRKPSESINVVGANSRAESGVINSSAKAADGVLEMAGRFTRQQEVRAGKAVL